MRHTVSLSLLLILAMPALAGCLGADEIDDVRIAFTYRESDLEADKDPQRLAAWVAAETGVPAKIYTVDDSAAALEALRFGQADIAILDGAAAWLGWQRFDLQALVAETRDDGRTFYNAAAWVRADSDIQSAADLAGRDSCHTGLLKSAGMLLPTAHLIREGLIDTSAYPDEISAVEDMVHDFFGTATIGGAYSGYEGALRCLSDGTGDVAFIRDTTPADYCGDDAADWCLDQSAYRQLFVSSPAPTHPVMVSPHVSSDLRDQIADALVGLAETEQGQSILENVIEAPGLVRVDTEAHLKTYGDTVSILPGFIAWTEEKNRL